jgi:hypothetical protein
MKAVLLVWLLLAPLAAHAQEYANDYEVQTRRDEDGPSAWETQLLWSVNPQQKLIWIRRAFDLPTASISSSRPLSLQVSGTASYEAWWNGVFIGRNGTPGASKATEIPGRLDSIILIPHNLLRPGRNELLLKMSSFHLPGRLGAPIQAISLREIGSTPFQSRIQNALRMMAAGALLLGSVYFGALFFSNRRDRSSLLLALLSLSVLGQLLAESIRFFVRYSYPFHMARLWMILGFACISATLLVAYVAHRYAPGRLRALLIAVLALAVASIALMPGYDGKTVAVMVSGLLVCAISAGTGMRAKTRGAGVALLLILASLVVACADLAAFIDRTWYLTMAALLFMLFWQQVLTLRRVQREQAETQLRSARLELELLRQQIQPHFLMNTLTALCEWVESDPATGVKMIEAVGEELRAIAVMGEASTVPLGQELELCRHHLRVMGFRRNRRFTLRTQGLDLDAPVPPALFHTLIENAFTHNAHADGAEFVLTEQLAPNGRCRYELRSPRTRSATRGGIGKGHAYVRARLKHAFGDNWHFSSEAAANSEWVDCVEIPGKPACTS